MIEIEIDGKKLDVPQGIMIIEAADNAGIRIPRFCYHKKLSIAANCRMCLVEVEKVGKPLPACATPVTPGMKVMTQSAKAIDAQKSVMEFLLINHPLDCPICDQGGSCELQDISMGYGADVSRYTEGKRSVKDQDLGSLVATDMTRCIQCTRCVRFGQEIAGIREMGTIGRGEHVEIGTFLKGEILTSELSGNIIDLCPVGALTSKPFRFTARSWELEQQTTIAPHDAVGSNIYVHTRRGKVMRVVPKENEQVNETWISDRDRFSYEGMYSEDRLTMPMIKVNNQWQETDWTTALEFVTNELKRIQQQFSANQIAALASPNSTTEEFYLLQKLMRHLGSSNIDHRLHQTDTSDQVHMPLYPSLGMNIEDIEKQHTFLLIGSNIRQELPLIAHRIRKAQAQGAKVISVTNTKELYEIVQGDLFKEHFAADKKALILLGAQAMNHAESSQIRSAAQMIADKYQATLGILTAGANHAGAWLAGAIPHRKAAGEIVDAMGLSTQQALAAKLKAYLLFNIEPDQDIANAVTVNNALAQAECVIAFSAFKAESLLAHAHVLLPTAIFAENQGTYVNLEGRWQSFSASVPYLGDARPLWKILRVLANLLNFTGFDYNTVDAVRDELQEAIKKIPQRMQNKLPILKTFTPTVTEFAKVPQWAIYNGDMLVRRANALQHAVVEVAHA